MAGVGGGEVGGGGGEGGGVCGGGGGVGGGGWGGGSSTDEGVLTLPKDVIKSLSVISKVFNTPSRMAVPLYEGPLKPWPLDGS